MSTTHTRHGFRSGPPGDTAEYWMPRDMAAWEASWDRHLGATAPLEPLSEEERERREADMSPEAVEARRIAKARRAEAMAFIASYTGTFGLILDIRANPRYGSKHLKLSDRQVDAVLASRDRDLARVEQARLNTELANDDEYQRYVQGLVVLGNAVAELLEPGTYRGGQSEVGDPDTFTVPDRLTTQDILDANPTLPTRTSPVPVTEGMYKLSDGTIAKVQRAIHGSGNLYAKRLVVTEGSTSGTFEYAPGLISRLRPEDRMALDEAAAFGKLYGWCCVCGRTLTDEKSIAAGIGPVCAAKV